MTKISTLHRNKAGGGLLRLPIISSILTGGASNGRSIHGCILRRNEKGNRFCRKVGIGRCQQYYNENNQSWFPTRLGAYIVRCSNERIYRKQARIFDYKREQSFQPSVSHRHWVCTDGGQKLRSVLLSNQVLTSREAVSLNG